MTEQAPTRFRVALALITFASLVGFVAWSPTGAAATESRSSSLRAAVARDTAIVPRFDPAQPTRLDEFSAVPQLRPVHFDFGKATIRPADVTVIDSDARWLQSNPSHDIVIEGYADARGTKPYNTALARQRAQALRRELVARGIDRNRIAIVSYGEARPLCHTKIKTDACWAQNRSAGILVRQLPYQAPTG
jgi:outer membrane protein OmpA-like peptidoglycan-associated protein